jgi:curved DNA-binding protein CbpA
MNESTLQAPEPACDPYAVLKVSRTAPPDEIKQAYFAQVRLYPPEREPDAFKRIRAAYDRLRTPENRLETDMCLLEEWPRSAHSGHLPEPDLSIHAEDLLILLKADTDLARTDFRKDFREVHL